MHSWLCIRAGHLPGHFRYAGTINKVLRLLQTSYFRVLSWWDKPFLSSLCLSYFFANLSDLLQVHPAALWHISLPLSFLCVFLPPAESEQRLTQKFTVCCVWQPLPAGLLNHSCFINWLSVIILHLSFEEDEKGGGLGGNNQFSLNTRVAFL